MAPQHREMKPSSTHAFMQTFPMHPPCSIQKRVNEKFHMHMNRQSLIHAEIIHCHQQLLKSQGSTSASIRCLYFLRMTGKLNESHMMAHNSIAVISFTHSQTRCSIILVTSLSHSYSSWWPSIGRSTQQAWSFHVPLLIATSENFSLKLKKTKSQSPYRARFEPTSSLLSLWWLAACTANIQKALLRHQVPIHQTLQGQKHKRTMKCP